MRTLKRIAFWLAAAVLTVAVLIGGSLMLVLRSQVPPVDETLADGTQAILDGHVAAFVVPLANPARVVLIDCGTDKDAKAIKAALKNRTVAAIFITHAHFDHVQGCAQFKDAKVYALADEVDAIEGRAGFHGPLTRFLSPASMAHVTTALKDGDDVDVEGLPVRAFALPGHTKGSAAYLIKTTLFLGDATGSRKDGTLSKPVWWFTDDPDQAVRSLAALGKRLGDEHVNALATFAFGHTRSRRADLFAMAAPR